MSDLNSLMKEISKQYKNDQVATLGSHEEDPTRIATGLFAFDLASGGGFPEGRCSVVFGPESAMKTTLCLKAIATAQRNHPKKKAVFVDVEGVFSAPWATKMGVDCKKLVIVRPDSAEQMVDVTEALLYASDVSLVVVDSLAALVTTHELNSEAEKAMVGNTGIIINKFYRKVGRALSLARREGHHPTIICINQIRSKIGGYGNPETMPGGKAFLYASSLTVRVYGKDLVVKEVHKDMPAYKEVKFIIKKYKVPIVAQNGMFVMALQTIAKPPLAVGQSYDWNTVVQYLKHLGLLVKVEKKWGLVDFETGAIEEYDKQTDIRTRMETEPYFNDAVKEMIVKAVLDGDESLPEPE